VFLADYFYAQREREKHADFSSRNLVQCPCAFCTNRRKGCYCAACFISRSPKYAPTVNPSAGHQEALDVAAALQAYSAEAMPRSNNAERKLAAVILQVSGKFRTETVRNAFQFAQRFRSEFDLRVVLTAAMVDESTEIDDNATSPAIGGSSFLQQQPQQVHAPAALAPAAPPPQVTMRKKRSRGDANEPACTCGVDANWIARREEHATAGRSGGMGRPAQHLDTCSKGMYRLANPKPQKKKKVTSSSI
jgi:hypothetical protein